MIEHIHERLNTWVKYVAGPIGPKANPESICGKYEKDRIYAMPQNYWPEEVFETEDIVRKLSATNFKVVKAAYLHPSPRESQAKWLSQQLNKKITKNSLRYYIDRMHIVFEQYLQTTIKDDATRVEKRPKMC